MKVLSRSLNLLTAIFISLGISFCSNSPAQTQSTTKRSPDSAQENKLDFSGDGRPGRRKGGGSRSTCPNSDIPLTALVPKNNIGTTVSDRPSLWFYVPYRPEQVGAIEVVLQDESENDVYRQAFALPKTPGLVNFQLPQNAPPLAVNQSYRWYFKLYCDRSSLATANFVEGWIKRIPLNPDLAARLKSKDSPAHKEYESSLVWFDSLDSLAQLRLSNDNPQLKQGLAKTTQDNGDRFR